MVTEFYHSIDALNTISRDLPLLHDKIQRAFEALENQNTDLRSLLQETRQFLQKAIDGRIVVDSAEEDGEVEVLNCEDLLIEIDRMIGPD